MIKMIKNCNMFSLLPKNDKVQISITPITLKFNCKSCNKINKIAVGHIKLEDEADFDISNTYNYGGTTWRLNCSSCNAINDIELLLKHYKESEKMEAENGKL